MDVVEIWWLTKEKSLVVWFNNTISKLLQYKTITKYIQRWVFYCSFSVLLIETY